MKCQKNQQKINEITTNNEIISETKIQSDEQIADKAEKDMFDDDVKENNLQNEICELETKHTKNDNIDTICMTSNYNNVKIDESTSINSTLKATISMKKNNNASQETISQDSKIDDKNDSNIDKNSNENQIMSNKLEDGKLKQNNINTNEDNNISKDEDLIEINDSIEIAQINEIIDISDNNVEETTKDNIIVLEPKDCIE